MKNLKQHYLKEFNKKKRTDDELKSWDRGWENPGFQKIKRQKVEDLEPKPRRKK